MRMRKKKNLTGRMAACEDVQITAGSQAITFLRCFGPA